MGRKYAAFSAVLAMIVKEFRELRRDRRTMGMLFALPLVLLVIFLVTAPLMQQGMDVDLPETTTQALRVKDAPLILTVDKEGRYFLGRKEVAEDELEKRMTAVFEARESKEIFLRADKGAAYGVVVKAMAAGAQWAATPWQDRMAIFMKAADLLVGPWRDTLNAASMLNGGKTIYQAEIDAACEMIDFLRFNVYFAQTIYAEQPLYSSKGIWNFTQYRPLEGFVLAVKASAQTAG